ncbi:MAG: CheR family methyltransferase [Bacteroidales bacterium]
MTTRKIIEIVEAVYGKDLSAYSANFLRKSLNFRSREISSGDLEAYGQYLEKFNLQELEKLIASLTISYTMFFRNSIDISLLEGYILPELLNLKINHNSHSVRIWSVGCSSGPEAYTLTMIADKVACERNHKIPIMVFGTDVSEQALVKARAGIYELSDVQNVKLSYVNSCFLQDSSRFVVNEEIRKMVDFSSGDIISPWFHSPAAGIFADFDLVSCCNLMIYYTNEIQQMILEKLYKSLNTNGYLVVGESETSVVEKFNKFRKVYPCGNIFIKE